MGNFLRSISSFIGGRAETTAAHPAAPEQTTPLAPNPALHGDAVEPDASDLDEPSASAARDLPLVPYAAPHEETPAPRPRRSRAVSLLRSAAASAVTSRAVPTLHTIDTRHPAHPAGPLLTETERIRLQVMQAQIQLTVLRLYEGPIDGHMSPATATAVRYFQTLKGFRATGTLAAGTLAALSVPLIA
jgi:hypothetical protein